MEKAEFKAGDRVKRVGRATVGTLIGPDLRPDYPERWIVWRHEGAVVTDTAWVSWSEREFEHAPETVTVTVELPRDEAESIAEDRSRVNDWLGGPAGEAVHRFAHAAHEALA